MRGSKGRKFKQFVQNTLCRMIICPVVFRMYNYKCEKIKGVDGPALILANHNTNMDPFLVGFAMPGTMAFVATENVLRGKITGWLLARIVDIIVHRKGKSGLRTVMEIKDKLAMGDSVVMFPEGNRSFNGETLDSDYEGLVKLISRLKATIVTYRLEGGYLTTPRWAITRRKGALTGKVMNIYSADILRINPSSVAARIREDLYVNAFEDQKNNRIKYKGKRLAYGMESTLFMCPACQSYSSLMTDDNNIFCECGLRLKYNEYGEFINEGAAAVPEDFNILRWDRLQRDDLFNKDINSIEFVKDDVTISTIGEDHNVISSDAGYLKIAGGQLEVNGNSVDMDMISGVSVFSRNVLTAYYGEKHYEIRGNTAFNALKYYYLYLRIIGEKE